MRAPKLRLNLFRAMGAGMAVVLLGCSSAGSAGGGQPGSGGQAAAGTSGNGAGSGGTGATAGAGNGIAGATGGGGQVSNSATGGRGSGAAGSKGAGGSGAAGSGGRGGSANMGGSGTGGPDASTGDANTSSAGCTGLLFCDDFESYAAGATPSGKWTAQVRGSAKAVVDTTMSYSGSRSVHFTGTVNQSSANLIAQGAPVFPIQGNSLYLRMMMYINTYPATSGTHSRFMRIGTNTGGGNGTAYALDTYNGVGIEHVNSGMFRDTGLHLGDTVVTGKWVCWEWELDNTAGPPPGDTGSVMAYLWRDSTPLPLAVTHDSLAWDPIPWQLLEVGLEAYQADSVPGDFWIDDVALNNKRIGCPTK